MFDLLFANILGLYNIKRFLGGKDFDMLFSLLPQKRKKIAVDHFIHSLVKYY